MLNFYLMIRLKKCNNGFMIRLKKCNVSLADGEVLETSIHTLHRPIDLATTRTFKRRISIFVILTFNLE